MKRKNIVIVYRNYDEADEFTDVVNVPIDFDIAESKMEFDSYIFELIGKRSYMNLSLNAVLNLREKGYNPLLNSYTNEYNVYISEHDFINWLLRNYPEVKRVEFDTFSV